MSSFGFKSHWPRTILAKATLCLSALFAPHSWSATPPNGYPDLTEDELIEITKDKGLGMYKGYAEFKMAHYSQAKQIWQKLQAKGSGDAVFNLGILAEDGLGESKNPELALRLYQQAAQMGSRLAQYRLGVVYAEGGLTPKNTEQAKTYLAMAAQAGDEDAKRRLAALENPTQLSTADQQLQQAEKLTEQGRTAEAATLLTGLSEQGNTRARTKLAWMYEAGRGVGRSLGKAAELFTLSAQQGDAEAQYAIAVMLKTGTGKDKDEQASLNWLKQSAANGYPPAVQALAAQR